MSMIFCLPLAIVDSAEFHKLHAQKFCVIRFFYVGKRDRSLDMVQSRKLHLLASNQPRE